MHAQVLYTRSGPTILGRTPMGFFDTDDDGDLSFLQGVTNAKEKTGAAGMQGVAGMTFGGTFEDHGDEEEDEDDLFKEFAVGDLDEDSQDADAPAAKEGLNISQLVTEEDTRKSKPVVDKCDGEHSQNKEDDGDGGPPMLSLADSFPRVSPNVPSDNMGTDINGLEVKGGGEKLKAGKGARAEQDSDCCKDDCLPVPTSAAQASDASVSEVQLQAEPSATEVEDEAKQYTEQSNNKSGYMAQTSNPARVETSLQSENLKEDEVCLEETDCSQQESIPSKEQPGHENACPNESNIGGRKESIKKPSTEKSHQALRLDVLTGTDSIQSNSESLPGRQTSSICAAAEGADIYIQVNTLLNEAMDPATSQLAMSGTCNMSEEGQQPELLKLTTLENVQDANKPGGRNDKHQEKQKQGMPLAAQPVSSILASLSNSYKELSCLKTKMTDHRDPKTSAANPENPRPPTPKIGGIQKCVSGSNGSMLHLMGGARNGITSSAAEKRPGNALPGLARAMHAPLSGQPTAPSCHTPINASGLDRSNLLTPPLQRQVSTSNVMQNHADASVSSLHTDSSPAQTADIALAVAHGPPVQKPQTIAVDFMETNRELHNMMLEVQELQETMLELRVRTAISANKLTRLESPMLSHKLTTLKRKAQDALGLHP